MLHRLQNLRRCPDCNTTRRLSSGSMPPRVTSLRSADVGCSARFRPPVDDVALSTILPWTSGDLTPGSAFSMSASSIVSSPGSLSASTPTASRTDRPIGWSSPAAWTSRTSSASKPPLWRRNLPRPLSLTSDARMPRHADAHQDMLNLPDSLLKMPGSPKIVRKYASTAMTTAAQSTIVNGLLQSSNNCLCATTSTTRKKWSSKTHIGERSRSQFGIAVPSTPRICEKR
mmetsp:Transcript_14144/g.38823  ORF Transcript_14144/g.38823 Transcript_14144/m.38823 type:complete len:229 (+) Transcript_14144:766-1452(+)